MSKTFIINKKKVVIVYMIENKNFLPDRQKYFGKSEDVKNSI
jgi:hypothetical protein